MNSNSSNEVVYGQTFSSYTDKEFEDFSAFFERRLINNGLVPKDIFENKICLDAGCGGGRGSWLMLKYGAKRVLGVDQSSTNTESFRKRIANSNLSEKFYSVNVDLEELDLSEKFDFIWFSGVIQHTKLPSKVFKQVYKHLKIGGSTFFYAYGKNGIYWQLVDLARKVFNRISDNEMLEILKSLSLENRYIAEYMDDWKVPFLRAYSDNQMRDSLSCCGISPLIRLFWGENYDTCLRSKIYAAEKELWGEGDLRYFGVKTKEFNGTISNDVDVVESTLSEGSIYHSLIKKCSNEVSNINNTKDQVIYLARIQKLLRDTMNKPCEFDANQFEKELKA